MKSFFIGFLIIVTPLWAALGQKPYHIDSSYVKFYPNTFSVRTLAVFKHQDLVISNRDGDRIKYVPKNPFSAGLGLSYEFLIGDIAIRLDQSDGENATSRFDLQASVPYRNHVLDLYIQRYEGFHSNASDGGGSSFRNVVGSTAWGFHYYYNFNGRKLPVSGNVPGNRVQKKSTGSFLLGAYYSYNDLDADTTLLSGGVSTFNFADLRSVKSSTFGVSAGCAGIVTLPGDYYLFASAMPGFGISNVQVTSTMREDTFVKSSWKINGRVAVGKNFGRVYSGVVFSTDYFFMSIADDHIFSYRRGMLKAVLGVRFNAKGTLFERVLAPILP